MECERLYGGKCVAELTCFLLKKTQLPLPPLNYKANRNCLYSAFRSLTDLDTMFGLTLSLSFD